MSRVEELRDSIQDILANCGDVLSGPDVSMVDALILAVRDEDWRASEAKKKCDEYSFRRWTDGENGDVDCYMDCPAHGTKWCE